MTWKEWEALLEGTGLPVAYHHWHEPPSVPYLVYLETGGENFFADNKVALSFSYVDVELYCQAKDREAEKKVEQALATGEIGWEKSETYIDSERLYQVIYECEVLIHDE